MSKLVIIAAMGGFAIAGIGYYTRYNVSGRLGRLTIKKMYNRSKTILKDKFSKQKYYNEGIRLLEGYAPLADKLGRPIKYRKIDIADEFNYQDESTAKVIK
jgi:hypothetical protein